jgi:uncharacterized protein (TIGR00369 family)
MSEPASMDLPSLQRLLDTVFAPWVRELGLRVTHAKTDEVHLVLPITTQHVHGGGVVCGQTLMAAADTAMVLAVASQLGGFKPMTTVQLQTSFLRPIAANDTEALVVARVLRLGKNLAFGEIEVQDAYGRLAAHCTTTYALL